jgi:hypothetical protein
MCGRSGVTIWLVDEAVLQVNPFRRPAARPARSPPGPVSLLRWEDIYLERDLIRFWRPRVTRRSRLCQPVRDRQSGHT